MKHCTLPTHLAVETTILPTVSSSRAGQKRQKSETCKLCIGPNFNDGLVSHKKPYLMIN